VGLVPLIRKLAGEGMAVTLAVSLHAPDDGLRDELIPVNSRWKVGELLDAAHDYFRATGRRVSIEYALIKDMNDHAWRAPPPRVEPTAHQPRPPRYNADWQQAPYTYSAAMHDLEPETVYEFRIGSAAETKEWQSFKTGKKKENTYKVIVMGDSQSVDYDVWGKTVQAAATNSNDAVFWIGMGDLTDNGQAWFQWRGRGGGGGPLAHLPFAPVLGNHEAYSLDWSFAAPEIYTALFPVSENGPKGQRKLAYSFDYGDVHYVSLNTDYEELREQNPTMLTDEAAWARCRFGRSHETQAAPYHSHASFAVEHTVFRTSRHHRRRLPACF